MKLCMFRTVPLSIIRSYSLYTQQWYMSYRFVDSFPARSGWNCSKAVYKPVWHILLLSVQWITPEDGQRNCPKHVDFHFQNKFEKLVHLVGFIVRKYATVHGQMNVKNTRLLLLTTTSFSGAVLVCKRVRRTVSKRLLSSSCLSVRPSVRSHGSIRLLLEEFSWN
jgi:hypothetical protein